MRYGQRMTSPQSSGRVREDKREPTGVAVDFKVPLHEVERGVEIHEDLPAVWVSALLAQDIPEGEAPWVATAPCRIDLRLSPEAGLVRMRGTGRFTLAQPCVRCLESIGFEVPIAFDLRLAEGGPEWDGTGVIDLDPQQLAALMNEDQGDAIGELMDADPDVDMATFNGNVIDVSVLLREQLFLEFPHYPSCTSKLAVLESACTFDLEAAMKPDKERWVASKWAGLEAFRDVVSDKKPSDDPEDS